MTIVIFDLSNGTLFETVL